MRCAACSSQVDGWDTSSLCPACHAITGTPLPAKSPPHGSPLWLWTTPEAGNALATRDLAVIVKAYRRAAGLSQAALAADLGYDVSYISMIENGRRTISDVPTLRRLARHLGLPSYVLGVTDPHAADFTSMIQFGKSTVRLAQIARQSGHSAAAINELWPVIWHLESRLAEGNADGAALELLTCAQAALGVALGDVLPEEQLASSARWTGRALRIAAHLDEPGLLAQTLRAHGNELRKSGRKAASAARLAQSTELVSEHQRGAVLIPLARTLGDLGDAEAFDSAVTDLRRLTDSAPPTPLVNAHVLREVHLRGLLATGRIRQAAAIAGDGPPSEGDVAPQWLAIERVTTAEVLHADGDTAAAGDTLRQAITIAEEYRLPHQIQRAARTARSGLPEIAHHAQAALERLRLTLPAA